VVFGLTKPMPASFKGEHMLFSSCIPCHTFTGYYLGANTGWKWASYETTFNSQAFTVGGVATPPESFEFNSSKNSFTGGGQVGYNLQTRQFLFGFEADWNAQSIGNNATIETSTSNPVFVAGDTFKTKTRWENSYRLRMGYVYRNWLLYGTAGVSRIAFQVTGNLLSPDATNNSVMVDTVKKTSTGETVGVGTEVILSKYWSVGLEYRYSMYPGKNYHMDDLTVNSSPFIQTPINVKVRDLNTNQVLFKVNFRVYA
jgi:outer membrane immunogenic protein